ncbi:MAG TPA: TldD/PmbA family protein [Thermodesulfobacteriota bacterium]|nr:TldD/PmbA family protein [Thermodesulfobacteriota bacterium]
MADKGSRLEAGSEEAIGALVKLLAGGVDSYEIFFSSDFGVGAESREETVDALKVSSNKGVGLRVIKNGRLGFGFTSVLTGEALTELVANTVDGSVEASSDEFLTFPSPPEAPMEDRGTGVFDETFGTSTEEEKIQKAIDIERSARGCSPRIRRVRKASYSESIKFIRVVNSRGVDCTHRATYFSGSVTAIAEEDGASEVGWEVGMGHKKNEVDTARIGEGAARNAVRMLGARRIKTVRCPALIENTVVCELLEALSGSFLADNVHKGKSMLKDRVGAKVASVKLNVIDDGTLPGGWATSPFDGEGSPRGRTTLLKEGVLNGYLYDSYWAGRFAVKSTGNASRSRYNSMPSVGISNLYIEEGEKGIEELFRKMGSGLFITELMGVHTINTVTGDFSVGASGLWVEDAAPRYPVRGMAVAGNLLGLFSSIEEVGGDMRFIGSIGSPSILFKEIEASGS